MKTVSPAEVVPIVRTSAAGSYVLSNYIGSYAEADEDLGFQAFLVEQKSPELRAHFHEVDQFQIVVSGRGSLGREPVTVGAVHYTDGYTSYGPIRTADAEGLAYFTLRVHPTIGANYMPESRDKRAAGEGANGHFTCAVDLSAAEGLDLLAESPRGARAYACRLAADSTLTADGLADADAPGYVVVLAGTVRADGRTLPAKSIISFDRPAELAGVRSSAEAATLAVVLFPDAA